jgi:hypothetical protein
MRMAADLESEDQKKMLSDRRSMWDGFTKLTTYSIVGIAILLILMALWLL